MRLTHTLIANFFKQFAEEKRICYHCDDTMRQSKVVLIYFDGDNREVCCHGCAAILKNIEAQHLIAEYYQAKIENQAA